MEYLFTDSDKRTYRRETSDHIVIEAQKLNNNNIELSLTDTKGKYLMLMISDSEADAICSAIMAAKGKCNCKITI